MEMDELKDIKPFVTIVDERLIDGVFIGVIVIFLMVAFYFMVL